MFATAVLRVDLVQPFNRYLFGEAIPRQASFQAQRPCGTFSVGLSQEPITHRLRLVQGHEAASVQLFMVTARRDAETVFPKLKLNLAPLAVDDLAIHGARHVITGARLNAIPVHLQLAVAHDTPSIIIKILPPPFSGTTSVVTLW